MPSSHMVLTIRRLGASLDAVASALASPNLEALSDSEQRLAAALADVKQIGADALSHSRVVADRCGQPQPDRVRSPR